MAAAGLIALVAIVVGAVLAVTLSHGGARAGRASAARVPASTSGASLPAGRSAAATTADPPLGPAPTGPFSSVVAAATGASVQLYPAAGGSPEGTLPNPNNMGTQLTFLVHQDEGSWLQVWVPTRPDGRTAWVQASQVRLYQDPYAVLVNLARHTATVWNGAQVMLSTPAAVGKPSTPTPTGTYFLAELLRQPDPAGAYGPYAYGLSAYSEVLQHFGGGPGQIGLHGTNEPRSIGQASSHGCVRIPSSVVTELAPVLPLGTPVYIGYWS